MRGGVELAYLSLSLGERGGQERKVQPNPLGAAGYNAVAHVGQAAISSAPARVSNQEGTPRREHCPRLPPGYG
jgi:hypothetical protein